MEPSLEDRLAVASALILQSPPGEVNDVFNDLRPIVGDDNQLETGLLPALSQYNTEQFSLVDLPNAKMPAMICSAARLDKSDTTDESESRYLDPNSQQSFVFDHLRLTASQVEKFPIGEDDAQEKIRSELNRETEGYVKSHYQDAFWSVFSINKFPPSKLHGETSNEDAHTQVESIDQSKISEDTPVDQESSNPDRMAEDHVTAEKDPSSDPPTPPKQTDQPIHNEAEPTRRKFQLYIVGNKYNPSNYWTGRWRSNYEIDLDSNQIKGHIQVNVHYYEQGNVQLSTNYEPIIEITSKESEESEVDNNKQTKKIKKIIKLIERLENDYQNSLNSAYIELGDNTFKQLRRALPVTKQKINWNNIKSRMVLNDN